DNTTPCIKNTSSTRFKNNKQSQIIMSLATVKWLKNSLVAAVLVLPVSLLAQSTPYDLRCDYLTTPLGIDGQHPTLSWKLPENFTESSSKDKPVYYKIIVRSAGSDQAADAATVWNSGFRLFTQPFAVYQGAELAPFTRYDWQVICTQDTLSQ